MITIDLIQIFSLVFPSLVGFIIAILGYRQHRTDVEVKQSDLKQQADAAAAVDLLAQYRRIVDERDRALVRREACETKYDRTIIAITKIFGLDALQKIQEYLDAEDKHDLSPTGG